MTTPIRVLIVEDSEQDAALLLHELQRGGYAPEYARVETAKAIAVALEQQAWDVVISDYVMPGFSALAALSLVRKKSPELPFIIVSGKVGEDIAVETMKAGASDYISKGNLARLVPAIQREIREAAMRQESKMMAQQLLRAQRLEMAGTVAGQVAHEFNNLLSPLVGYAQLMKKGLSPDSSAAKYCDIIIASAQRMAAISEDLLTLSRRGHFEQAPLDLNRLVRQSLAAIPAPAGSLVVQAELAPGLLPVCGSEAQLSRAITNLISNARDAMQDAGLLAVRTENVYVEGSVGERQPVKTGEYVKIEVSDTGCGIPPEIGDKMFDPFFTTKRTERRHGTGLGLSIAQTIVHDHRGYLVWESEPGKGATFSVHLPVCRKPGGESRSKETRGGNESILVVDDDEIQRELAKELLAPLGYSVSVAGSGEEAVARLREVPVDLLVLDMVMVGGIDGAETYRRVLELRPGQRAIIVSGFAESERVRMAKDLGASAFLRKPVTLENLACAVRKALERK